MNVTITKHWDGAIEFHTDQGVMFYDISLPQQAKGLDLWVDHLSRKSWFTPDVKDQFRKTWGEKC